MVYLFVGGFRMLLDFFVWDVKTVRNIYRNRHAVAGRRLLVRLFLKFSGFRECMWHILKTLRRFGQHISFVWFDSNLLQQVSVAVVQFLTVKCPGVLSVCNVSRLLLLQENISRHGRKISVDLTSPAIVLASVQLCIMLKTGELL